MRPSHRLALLLPLGCLAAVSSCLDDGRPLADYLREVEQQEATASVSQSSSAVSSSSSSGSGGAAGCAGPKPGDPPYLCSVDGGAAAALSFQNNWGAPLYGYVIGTDCVETLRLELADGESVSFLEFTGTSFRFRDAASCAVVKDYFHEGPATVMIP